MSDKEGHMSLHGHPSTGPAVAFTALFSFSDCSCLPHWWPPSPCFSSSSPGGTNCWKNYATMTLEPLILLPYPLMARTSAYAITLGFTQCWASVSGLWSELGRCTTYQCPIASTAKMDCSIFLVLKGPTLWILSLSVDRVWKAMFWGLSHPHAYTADTLINITPSSALTFMLLIYILIYF